MEIKTEADDVDEGVSPGDLKTINANQFFSLGQSSRYTSPRIRKKLKSMQSFNSY